MWRGRGARGRERNASGRQRSGTQPGKGDRRKPTADKARAQRTTGGDQGRVYVRLKVEVSEGWGRASEQTKARKRKKSSGGGGVWRANTETGIKAVVETTSNKRGTGRRHKQRQRHE